MNPENYRSIAISKSLYKGPSGSLTRQLELLDPSEAYAGTELANLDAYQRQLKRFDIRVSGEGSSPIEKFFSTADSAALFPEYVSRAVQAGMGVGVFSPAVLRRELAEGQLRMLEVDGAPLPDLAFTASWRRGRDSHVAAAVARLAVQVAASSGTDSKF